MITSHAEQIKKRRPWLAGLLSVALPGLGHVYAGNLIKGLVLIALPYVAIALAALLLDLTLPVLYYAMLVCAVSYALYSIVGAVLLARKNKNYQMKKFNHWFFYLFLYSIFVVVSFVFPTFGKELLGFDSYRIVSQSMNPTLQIGDVITVDTRNRQPEVGDVIVFRFPPKPVHVYTFRVVAIGGDVISVNKGIVTRNGVVEDFSIPVEDEATFNGQRAFAETTIPEGETMVLGDNRARSNDSRFWGNVKTTEVIGKVRYVWFSKNWRRIGMKVQ